MTRGAQKCRDMTRTELKGIVYTYKEGLRSHDVVSPGPGSCPYAKFGSPNFEGLFDIV